MVRWEEDLGVMTEREEREKKRGENTSRLWPRCLSFISFAAGELDRCRKQMRGQIIRQRENTGTAILLCRVKA